MKITLMLILLQFQPIPKEYLRLDSLFKYLNPHDSISWWKAGMVNPRTGHIKELFCSVPKEDTELMYFSKKNIYSLFFGALDLYLSYRTDSVNYRFITNKKELVNFIGTVDNLPEALLIARLYDLCPGSSRSTCRYKQDGDSFILYITKCRNPPDVYYSVIVNGKVIEQEPELFKIKVCNNGDVFLFDEKTEEYRKLILSDVCQWR